MKWEAVAEQPVRPHYVVCNADESEPGTFKDRVLMEQRSVRAHRGDDDRRLRHRLASAATSTSAASTRSPRERLRARDRRRRARAGSSATTSWAHGFAFDIELRRGAGAYICGEETALFNSIEGKRGEPRNKPPFPVEARRCSASRPRSTTSRRWSTCCRSSSSARAAFAAIGTADSTGTRLFCLSGHVERPGVYELPFGVTLGDADRSWPAACAAARAAGGAARRGGGRVRRARRARRRR